MNKIKIGVMPAAGMGNRINSLPLTRILPKSLLPILNKPIMEYGIDNMKTIGVEELYIIVGFKKDLIKEYFGNGKDFGLDIKYVVQPTPNGIAAAVELVREYVKEPFIITLGDDLTVARSLDNLVKDFWTKNAKIVEGVVLEHNVEKLKLACCVTLGKQDEMLDIVEKPTALISQIRGCGIYICDPLIFDFINKTPFSLFRKEREITDTLRLMAKMNLVYGSFIDGTNINVNTIGDLIDALKLILDMKEAQA